MVVNICSKLCFHFLWSGLNLNFLCFPCLCFLVVGKTEFGPIWISMIKHKTLTIIVVLLRLYETDNLLCTHLAFILFEMFSTGKNGQRVEQDSQAKG